MTAELGLDTATIRQLKDSFLLNLRHPAPVTEPPKQQFLLVAGSAPGGGKTTVARMLSEMSGAFHVQANSARYLLDWNGLRGGENVHAVIAVVVRELMSSGASVIVDGMITEAEERQLARDLAAEYGAKTFFAAVICHVDIAKHRARKRYLDGKPSTFDDWRAKNPEAYIQSIYPRAGLLQESLHHERQGWDGVRRINNDDSEKFLRARIHVAWNDLHRQLD